MYTCIHYISIHFLFLFIPELRVKGSARASPSRHRENTGWHAGQVTSSSQGHMRQKTRNDLDFPVDLMFLDCKTCKVHTESPHTYIVYIQNMHFSSPLSSAVHWEHQYSFIFSLKLKDRKTDSGKRFSIPTSFSPNSPSLSISMQRWCNRLV